MATRSLDVLFLAMSVCATLIAAAELPCAAGVVLLSIQCVLGACWIFRGGRRVR